MKETKRKLMLIDEDDDQDITEGKSSKINNVSADDDGEDEDDDDGDDLDEFENDGFIVDDYEVEEENQDGKDGQKTKKKKKRKSLKDFVLDDDDLELLQENKISGLVQTNYVKSAQCNEKFKRFKKADASTRSRTNSEISDDDEEEAMLDSEEDEMADFIADDEIGYHVEAKSMQLKLREKMSKQVTVATSSILEETGSMFGSTDEILKHHVVKIVKPDDFNEHEMDDYTSERHGQIKESYVPERMQMFEEIVGPASFNEMSREEEGSWILDQLAGKMCHLYLIKGTDLDKKISKEDILRFLELRHLDKFDIPFIAMYRKEKCHSLLKDPEEDGMETINDNIGGGKLRLKWHKILWAVNELDKKWFLMQTRKSALQRYYIKRYEDECGNVDDVMKLSSHKQQFDRIIKSLKSAETERDIDDVDTMFSLYFPPSAAGMTRKFKQPDSGSEYRNCSLAGLWKLAGKFGCSPEQFGLQLTLEKGKYFREDPAESPEAMALDFVCPMFETPEAVLKGARLMAAMEVSCEPCVRKHIRGIFMDNAVVSTCPTPEGDERIDTSHLFYAVKWLSDKPIDMFQEAQWLLIQKAEEEKLLQVTINLPNSVLNKLIADAYESYLVSNGDMSTQVWDEQRKLIIEDAFSSYLLPSLDKETRALLTTRAKNWLCVEYGKQLWNRASVALYQQKENVAGQYEGIAPKVMACCWGPGKPPITFVMLGSSGQLLDVLQARFLCLRSKNVIEQQRKKYDQQCVLKFIVNHRPNVIVIGALNVSCTQLKDDIEEIIHKIEEDSVAVDQMMHKMSIVYGDESLAQLYESSKVSSCQLPGQEGIVRRAVALGRYLQNPLVMIATLCGPQKEILSWKLNSLDHFLTPDEKYEMIEMVLVDVTNQVGVDLYFAVNHEWLFAPLQFISGLGPHKAAFLQRELVGGKTFNKRYDLADCGLRPKQIFYNAVGFLRVHSNQLLSTPSDFDLLDDTRIHPESYGLAERLAEAVLQDVSQAQPILYIKDNPELLNNFNIDEFADNYEAEQGKNKRETLYAITNELRHGFLDPRNPFEDLTQDELFYLISGKNEEAFTEGRIMQVVVQRVLSQRAFCALDSGLTGVIMKEDYLDGSDDFSLTDKLHEGDIITCKIKDLEKSRYQVLLTCKESELKSCRNQNFHEVDPYYCKGKKSLSRPQDEASVNELAKNHFKQRIITHPNFKNITMDQAMEFLSDKDVGDNIFRPSSRGLNYLTMTLKVYDGLLVHKDIIEGKKDSKAITGLLQIGKSLKIGDHIYNDLDEVMDQYVNPLVSHLKTMIGFRKFRRGSKAEVDKLLRAEKSEYPMRIAYCFGLSYEHPGTFILSYIRTSNLHHEFIGLYPEGFRFRKHMFPKVEQLVAHFQQHIDDLKHGSGPTRNGSSTTDFGGRKGYSREGHPSGLPRPNGGRGRGRGRGRGNGKSTRDIKGEEFGGSTASKWGCDFNDGDKNNGSAWGSADTGGIGSKWGGVDGQSERHKQESMGGHSNGENDHANMNTFSSGWGSGTSNDESWDKSFGSSNGGWDKKDDIPGTWNSHKEDGDKGGKWDRPRESWAAVIQGAHKGWRRGDGSFNSGNDNSVEGNCSSFHGSNTGSWIDNNEDGSASGSNRGGNEKTDRGGNWGGGGRGRGRGQGRSYADSEGGYSHYHTQNGGNDNCGGRNWSDGTSRGDGSRDWMGSQKASGGRGRGRSRGRGLSSSNCESGYTHKLNGGNDNAGGRSWSDGSGGGGNDRGNWSTRARTGEWSGNQGGSDGCGRGNGESSWRGGARGRGFNNENSNGSESNWGGNGGSSNWGSGGSDWAGILGSGPAASGSQDGWGK